MGRLSASHFGLRSQISVMFDIEKDANFMVSKAEEYTPNDEATQREIIKLHRQNSNDGKLIPFTPSQHAPRDDKLECFCYEARLFLKVIYAYQ